MNLKTATSLAVIGAVLFLLAAIYNAFIQHDIIVVTLENYKQHYTVMTILNIAAGVLFLNFFISFLLAQKRRG